jgi:hypothetical protein
VESGISIFSAIDMQPDWLKDFLARRRFFVDE